MNKYLLTVFIIGALPLAALAQKGEDEGPVGIFESRAEYNQFMGTAKRAAFGESGSPALQAMIPMINDIALDKPVGWTANAYGVGGSTLGLLSDSKIRADLEMVDDQYRELQDLSSRIQQRAADQLRGINFEDSDDLVDRIKGIREQAEDELNSVLLPHQLKRLQQIRMQSQLRRRSLVDILTNDPVKSELEITDKQSDELRDAEGEIKEDLEREIAKLREKAQDRLLSELNRSQKERVEAMIGDAFEFSPTEKKELRKNQTGGRRK